MLYLVTPEGGTTTIAISPAREAVVSWNATAPAGSLELSVRRLDGARSGWLPYVTWNESERRSLSGRDEVAEIERDILRAPLEITEIAVRADIQLESVAVSTPFVGRAGERSAALDWLLDVPQRSQYSAAHPDERGWCSPAALSMLLAYWDIDLDVAEVAQRVRDRSYDGTGNWSFNVALAGAWRGRTSARPGLRRTVHRSRHPARALDLVGRRRPCRRAA
jgi:hypothetical protein